MPPAAAMRRVAGVSAPAFVERASGEMVDAVCHRVAGVSAPAFVERTNHHFADLLIRAV